MQSRVIVAPPVEPLSLAEVKLDRAVEHALHDGMLLSLIAAARQHVENVCQISLVTQTRETVFGEFFDTLELPYGPVQSVVSMDYVAGDGTVTPWTDYQSDLGLVVGRVTPSFGAYWPAVRAVYNAVTVRYIAGYPPVAGSPTDYTSNVPAAIKTAMKLLVGNWYENREATVAMATQALPLGVDALLLPYRMRLGMA